MDKDAQRKIVESAAAKLGEHFDSVQIIVTVVEDGCTRCIKSGVGNWYARQGSAQEFINEEVAVENARQIACRINPPDDESWRENT